MPKARTQKLSTITSLDEEDENQIGQFSVIPEDDEPFVIQKLKLPDQLEIESAKSFTTVSSLPFSGRMTESQIMIAEKKNVEIDNIINSAELESNVDITEIKPAYDDTGLRTYTKACEKFCVNPISNCIKSFAGGSELDLNFYGIGSKNCLAISMALVINNSVSTVNLQGNSLLPRDLGYLENMLDENMSITELNLAENNLRTEGAKTISRILESNKTLRTLNISKNNFSDTDGVILAKGVEEHSELTSLNLSHNNFGEISAPSIKSMLAENSCLQQLDLSWNHFLRGAGVYIAEGLAENVCIKELNLSWNGFEDDGATAVGKSLETNTVLSSLDLSCNRIGPDGFLALIGSFKHNDTLDILRVGKNNIPDQAAEAAVDLFLNINSIRLHALDMSDVMLRKSFDQKLEELKEIHPDLEVIYGYTDSYGKRKMVSYDAGDDAVTIIQQFVRKQNMSVIEMFRKFDTDGSQSVSYEEFEQGLKESGVILSPLQLELLIKKLDEDGDGEIDFSELVAAI